MESWNRGRICCTSRSRTRCSSARSAKCSMARRSRAPSPALRPSLREAAPGPSRRRNGTMEKLLVVDDDEALRRLMRLELCDSYEVIDSGEPEQGLALALESKPDAILLDLRMPKYSGYELLQTFTSFSHTQQIPVIIVSGEAAAQTQENSQQLRAAGHFEKPIDFEALPTCLRQGARSRVGTPPGGVSGRLHVSAKTPGTN